MIWIAFAGGTLFGAVAVALTAAAAWTLAWNRRTKT